MSETPSGRPTMLRMVLGQQLQAMREKAGLSYEEAAETIYVSHWTIRRMEAGEARFQLVRIKALLGHYGLTDQQEIDAFLDLARQANKPGWWNSYSDVLPSWFRVYIGLEESASVIRGFEPQFIPGLFQTGDYARALTEAGFPNAPAREITRRVDVRIARQKLLTREDAPHVWFVVDEAALRRLTGGPEVMRAQIAHLIDVCALPNVTVQVMPFSVGAHPGIGMVHLFRFPLPELPDIVYGESLLNAFYLDKPADVAAYVEALDRVSALAAPASHTVALLGGLRKEI